MQQILIWSDEGCNCHFWFIHSNYELGLRAKNKLFSTEVFTRYIHTHIH